MKYVEDSRITNSHFEVPAAFSELWIRSHITFHAEWKADALGDRFETSENCHVPMNHNRSWLE